MKETQSMERRILGPADTDASSPAAATGRERHVAVVTPWYPDAEAPYNGAFVEAMVEAVAPRLDRIDVYHVYGWQIRGNAAQRRSSWDLQERLLPRSAHPVPGVGGSALRRIPAPVPRTKDWAVHAETSAAWLGKALGGRPIEAPVVHAHVPILGGHAALEHCLPDARVYLTEHSSFLETVLAQPAARDLYDRAMDRCAGFFVVGAPLRELIGRTFPHHADKIRYIPNPVAFDTRREHPPARLRRWLSVAALSERKRVGYLLDGFAQCRADEPDLHLTVAGEGPLRAELEARRDDLGLAGAVDFLGAVEPADIPGLMAEHDLLVHTSRHETFGVVVAEALAVGIPVLVSRCGGPEQILEGAEDDAGQFFDVDDDPLALVEGYRLLRERHPEKTDLDRVRELLRGRYSPEAVADRHVRIWYGE